MVITKLRARLAITAMPILVMAVAGTASAQRTTTAAKPAPAPAGAAPAGTVLVDQAGVKDPAIRAVYAKAKWRVLWSPAAIEQLNTALADRARHGLDHVSFLPDPVGGASASDEDVARTGAALAYAAALAQGRVDPAALHQVYTLPRPRADLAAGLSTALANRSVTTWLDGLAPQDPTYKLLSAAYLSFSAKASVATPVQAIPSGLIRVGARDARVPAIVEQLVESGYLLAPETAAATGSVSASPAPAVMYTPDMAEALKALQTDYGIAADGVVGPETLKVLNLGAGDRARALAVGLERQRWLARTPPATRIDVNTAAAELRYYRDGVLVDQRKVIVGEPGRETPALSSPIYRLVANPTWTIPKSIQNGEMAKVDDAYLQAHNMVMRDGWIVQQPGPDNALGLVKFDMANDQAIYLHDTSAPALFDRSQRHLSHGCVRVEDAAGFAQMLADDQGVADAWQAAQASGEMTFVPLPRRIPVRLLYENVFASDDGKVAFRTDPYGWNDPVAEQLGFDRSSAKRAEAGAIDIGP